MDSDDNYRHKLRVRVCGILVENDRLLLVRLRSPVTGKIVWMPPGGGLEFGEDIESCLVREFHEETGLHIELDEFQFVNELIEPPYHAIELYYRVVRTGGQLRLGSDPEHRADSQLLQEVRWVPLLELSQLSLAPAKLREHFGISKSDDAE